MIKQRPGTSSSPPRFGAEPAAEQTWPDAGPYAVGMAAHATGGAP